MNKSAPHYLLFTQAKSNSAAEIGGSWRFVLEQIGTTVRIEESDVEPGVRGERLQLLAVVRGLEALEQQSLVTLITPSKLVGRGIRRGLTQWRQNNWKWERFGQMSLIKNHDLWQRIDHAMQIHQLNCRVWQFDPPHVRTQSVEESVQTELTQTGSPFISPIAEQAEHPVAMSAVPSQRRFSLDRSRKAIDSTLRQLSVVSTMLEDKVKPIGQGRAYGYAVN